MIQDRQAAAIVQVCVHQRNDLGHLGATCTAAVKKGKKRTIITIRKIAIKTAFQIRPHKPIEPVICVFSRTSLGNLSDGNYSGLVTVNSNQTIHDTPSLRESNDLPVLKRGVCVSDALGYKKLTSWSAWICCMESGMFKTFHCGLFWQKKVKRHFRPLVWLCEVCLSHSYLLSFCFSKLCFGNNFKRKIGETTTPQRSNFFLTINCKRSFQIVDSGRSRYFITANPFNYFSQVWRDVRTLPKTQKEEINHVLLLLDHTLMSMSLCTPRWCAWGNTSASVSFTTSQKHTVRVPKYFTESFTIVAWQQIGITQRGMKCIQT